MIRSLRRRILIWHSGILALAVFAFATVLYLQQSRARMRAIDRELSSGLEVLIGQLQSAPPAALQRLLNESRPVPEIDAGNDSQRRLEESLAVPDTFARRRLRDDSEAPYFVIWSDTGRQLLRSPSPVVVSFPDDGRVSGTLAAGQAARNRGTLREVFGPGPPGTMVLLGREIGPDLRELRSLLMVLIASGLGVFGLGLAGGWFLSRRAVQPIDEISRVAREISGSNLSQRIDEQQMDLEFAQLSDVLNQTFSRLEAAFAQQAQFTSDASHELRTPLSVLRMHLELALSRERSPDGYRETLRTCQRAVARMHELVESLLTLARFDSPEARLARESVDILAVVNRAIEDLRPLAEQRVIQLTQDSVSVIASCDSNQLQLVLSNLIRNAIAYSPDESPITVSVKRCSQDVRISVCDQGPGIAADQLPLVFRRFYRVDSERTRDRGGSGLGLSICTSIVEAHGGRISVDSQVGTGSCFHVDLPLEHLSSHMQSTES